MIYYGDTDYDFLGVETGQFGVFGVLDFALYTRAATDPEFALKVDEEVIEPLSKKYGDLIRTSAARKLSGVFAGRDLFATRKVLDNNKKTYLRIFKFFYEADKLINKVITNHIPTKV